MNFNSHSDLADRHSFLSPSSYHWINYDDQKLNKRFKSWKAARRGTDLHNFAREAIRLGVKLSKSNPTLSMYVHDALEYQMSVEQPLYYSDNCFGTADAICYRMKALRIFDLKTGITKCSFAQLETYAAIFCLEYGIDPHDISLIDLRIYQSGDVLRQIGDPARIYFIMDRIVELDMKTEILKNGGEL